MQFEMHDIYRASELAGSLAKRTLDVTPHTELQLQHALEVLIDTGARNFPVTLFNAATCALFGSLMRDILESMREHREPGDKLEVDRLIEGLDKPKGPNSAS